MTRIEQRLAWESTPAAVPASDPTHLLALLDQLAEPALEPITRLVLAQQLRGLLTQAGTPSTATDLPDAHPGNGHKPPAALATCPSPPL